MYGIHSIAAGCTCGWLARTCRAPGRRPTWQGDAPRPIPWRHPALELRGLPSTHRGDQFGGARLFEVQIAVGVHPDGIGIPFRLDAESVQCRFGLRIELFWILT